MTKENDERFHEMKSAKEHFTRKFAFIQEGDQWDLLNFKYPKSCQHYHSPTDKYDLLYIDLHGVKKLYDDQWLNDQSINFFMSLLNLANISTTPRSDVPKFVFVNTYDADFLLPSSAAFPSINKLLDIPNEDETEDLWNIVREEVKEWYCNIGKKKLSKLLDAYDARGKVIRNYVTCVNLSNFHWIVLHVHIGSDTSTPFVTTIDSMNGNDTAAQKYRLWYANFFTLLLKEKNFGQCQDEDFDIMSIKAELNGSAGGKE